MAVVVVVVMVCGAHGGLLMGVVDGESLKGGGAMGKFFALGWGAICRRMVKRQPENGFPCFQAAFVLINLAENVLLLRCLRQPALVCG